MVYKTWLLPWPSTRRHRYRLQISRKHPLETDPCGPGWARPVDIRAVTNADFVAFVSEPQYVTDAEQFGWSYVFAEFLPTALRRRARRSERTPSGGGEFQEHPRKTAEGTGSDISGGDNHPIVHVSWNNALAYCN
ncbi:SUMF1/EgtB/PvdO family nonheme iron enzyme [Rhodococcus sp. APC 3903]|uniref:SUMF1/EgtB/PvdO family nonheme iron enzyme n=1 Tax=Rhodococcus sp. APC 3903 TaxID=3035193 RepID=UPI0033A912D4